MERLMLTFLLHVCKTEQNNDNTHQVDPTGLNDNLFHKTTSWTVRVSQMQSITADLPFYFEPCAGEPCYPWHSEALDLFPELSGTIVLPCRISSSGDTALLNNTFSVRNFQ
jgi:hypothetical protein